MMVVDEPPGLGLFHQDKRNETSLAVSAIEADVAEPTRQGE